MLEQLFVWVYKAVSGSPAVALSASFVWGVLGVVVSPCHLASIPLIVGFISGQGRMSRVAAFNTSLLFALGVLVTIALIGIITASFGRMWGDVGTWGNLVVALVFILVGLNLLDVVALPFSTPGGIRFQRRGALAAFILGLVFGLALGPCTFGFMLPVLEASRRLASNARIALSVLIVALYGLGHCVVIVLAGVFTESVQLYLDWNERSRGAICVRRACGMIIVLAGIYLAYKALW